MYARNRCANRTDEPPSIFCAVQLSERSPTFYQLHASSPMSIRDISTLAGLVAGPDRPVWRVGHLCLSTQVSFMRSDRTQSKMAQKAVSLAL